MKNFKLSALFVLFTLFFSANLASAQKMNAEDILAKHLDSIGTSEKRSTIKNQLIFCDVLVSTKNGIFRTNGKSVFFSSGEKNLWGLTLDSNDYPQDKFGYDGKNVKVGFTRPGVRSALGGFIRTYDEVLKESLLGGALSASWALLRADSKKSKLSYEGTKKIDNKETYVLSYSPKNGSDLSVKMYFNTQTYQHIRTEYNRVIAATQGRSVDSSAGQVSNRYHIVEDFSNFQKLGGLNLPGSYKLFFSYFVGSAAQTEIEWKFSVTNYSYNQKLDENAFNIETK